MVLPFVLLALQAPAASPQETALPSQRPVRIWMDAQSPVSRGRTVRLYVEAAASGNLMVLHYRTDGRIEVLFPARPTDDPRITAGTYEVRGANNAPVWTVAEPDGTGMILAALSPDPVWFDEFSHDAVWRSDALHASWDGADPASALTDVVQRMLGDGAFNYDVLTYSVAPQAIAQARDSSIANDQASADQQPASPDDQPASCVACSGIEYQFFMSARFFRDHQRFGRGDDGRSASAPRPAVATPLVMPIRLSPRPALGTPAPRPVIVAPRQREEAGVAQRSRVEPLVSRRSATGSGGTSPDLRSAITLRYVRTRGVSPDRDAPPPDVGAQHAPAPQSPTAPSRRMAFAPATAAAPMVFRGSSALVLAPRSAPQPRGMTPKASITAVAPRAEAARGNGGGGVRGTWYVGGGRHR